MTWPFHRKILSWNKKNQLQPERSCASCVYSSGFALAAGTCARATVGIEFKHLLFAAGGGTRTRCSVIAHGKVKVKYFDLILKVKCLGFLGSVSLACSQLQDVQSVCD